MKKLLLIPALLTGSLALATPYSYEISPVIGYDRAESSLDMKDNGYMTGGVELQYNNKDWFLSPELTLLYAKPEYDATGNTSHMTRAMINGVKTYEGMKYLKPFAKVGLGVENFKTSEAGNSDGLFLDAGLGAKVPFTEHFALKVEAMILAKKNDNNWDRNALMLAGLTYSFGAQEQKVAPEPTPEPTPAPVVVAAPIVIDGDDDKDGVLNSKDKCPATKEGTNVDANGCFLDSDDDNDGIFNLADSCLNTPAGVKVDAKGCEEDKDKDGVLNASDICQNTVAGATVNSDGCAESITLHVNFENNSFDIKKESYAEIQDAADFLSRHTNYSAKIVGYTDSRGSAKYNKYLSAKRATAVKNLLIKKGAPSKNVTSLGRGETNPIASNMLKAGRAKNRRIEAELTKH